ncbi:MAG: homoserine dehydrogenase [Bilophila sp.]
MDTRPVLTIGLAGLGTVGSGLVRLLTENAEELRARTGCDFRLKTVAVRDLTRKRTLPEGVRLCADPFELAQDPEIDVVIELMGGIDTPRRLITRSLENGKHVITANKALLAEEGEGLFRLAAEQGATLLYEASVAGGIPIVQTLKESLCGNKILSLEGILNGTGNYILSEMTSHNVDFAPALAEAQEKGYAEADPTLDIDGYDTAHKLVLLIRLAWGVDYPYALLPVAGIRNLDRMDIDFAREFGYRIKLLGRARMQDGKLEAGVFPTLVMHTYLLARVGGAFNAIRIEGNAVGPLFLHGQGAGSLPTASAVLGDLVSVARKNHSLNSGFVKQVLPTADILSPAEARSTYYMRFMVKDTPGVLRDLAGALADQNVSIAQALQRGQGTGGVPLVFMTHEARAKDITRAVETMRASDFLLAPAIYYPVMG